MCGNNRCIKAEPQSFILLAIDSLHKKWRNPLKVCSVNVTFTEEILNGKLHFLCSDCKGKLLQ